MLRAGFEKVQKISIFVFVFFVACSVRAGMYIRVVGVVHKNKSQQLIVKTKQQLLSINSALILDPVLQRKVIQEVGGAKIDMEVPLYSVNILKNFPQKER